MITGTTVALSCVGSLIIWCTRSRAVLDVSHMLKALRHGPMRPGYREEVEYPPNLYAVEPELEAGMRGECKVSSGALQQIATSGVCNNNVDVCSLQRLKEGLHFFLVSFFRICSFSNYVFLY